MKVSGKVAQRFRLYQGGLLICRSTESFDQIAGRAVVEEDRPGILFPGIIIRARFNDRIVPGYVREGIQPAAGRAWFQQNARTVVGMRQIGSSDIEAFPMLLPPTDEQYKLVDAMRMDSRKIMALKAEIRSRAERAEADVEAMIIKRDKDRNLVS